MTSHHVICHVTAVTYLLHHQRKSKENQKKNQKKRNIKSRKIVFKLLELKTMDLVSILFSLIFLLFPLNFYWKRKTKCDMVIEATCLCDTEKGIEGSRTR